MSKEQDMGVASASQPPGHQPTASALRASQSGVPNAVSLRFRDAAPHGDYAPGPWEYNDPEHFTQGHGKFSETAVYAAGNAFPWRMCEIQGPSEACEIATAHLIAAAPDMIAGLAEAGEAIRELRLADAHAARTGDETRFDRALSAICQHENRIKVLIARARGETA